MFFKRLGELDPMPSTECAQRPVNAKVLKLKPFETPILVLESDA